MNGWINSLIDNSVQCWGCPVFDRLFQIVSNAAAAIYDKFVWFCVILFCVMFAFFVLNSVWQNIKDGGKDPWYKTSVQPVIMNSLVALVFLGMGVSLPRFITSITFEPAAQITLIYTQGILQTDTTIVDEKVDYQPMEMSDNGFFRPKLRDTIILLMKTTITQFQAYMKLGIVVMEKAFTWKALLGIGSLIKHILLLVIGIYLFINFAKLFFNFCFYFADIIIAMAFFAFFFPLSLVMMSFKDAKNVPSWMSGIGKGLFANQFKTVINAIVGLAAAVITYTIIMVIISKFFSSPDTSVTHLMEMITRDDNILSMEISDDNLMATNLMSTVVLVYILNFLYKQIPQITSMVLSAFNVKSETTYSEQLAKNAATLTKDAANSIKNVGKAIISGGDKKAGEEKKDGESK